MPTKLGVGVGICKHVQVHKSSNSDDVLHLTTKVNVLSFRVKLVRLSDLLSRVTPEIFTQGGPVIVRFAGESHRQNAYS